MKVATESAWFAARPSGTEDVYKIYAESFKGPEHLAEVQEAARSSSPLRWGLVRAARREYPTLRGIFTLCMARTPCTAPASHATWDADRGGGFPGARCASSESQNRWVHADELADLLRWCTALSTDPADLAGEWCCRGPALVGAGRLAADLRELTVRTFLAVHATAGARVREGIERIPEELRSVLTAYDRLPKLQRAVLMLSCLEGVTNTEIAGILDRTAVRARLERDHGLAAVGGDLTRCGPRWTSLPGICLLPPKSLGPSSDTPRHVPVGGAESVWPESLSELSQPCCYRSALCTSPT